MSRTFQVPADSARAGWSVFGTCAANVTSSGSCTYAPVVLSFSYATPVGVSSRPSPTTVPASQRASTNNEIASTGTATVTTGVRPCASNVNAPKSVVSGPPLVAVRDTTCAVTPATPTPRLPLGVPGVVGAHRTARTVEAPGANAVGTVVSDAYAAPVTDAPVTVVGLTVERFVTVTVFVFVAPTGTSPNATLAADTDVVTRSASAIT